MGTLLRVGNWRVMIYTLDHAPAHVHLVGPEGRAKIALNCPKGPTVPIDCRVDRHDNTKANTWIY